MKPLLWNLWKSTAGAIRHAAMGTAPNTGELTGPQGRHGIFSINANPQSWAPPPKRSIVTYREMRKTPTLAIARKAAWLPIKASAWSFETDGDVPPEALNEVERQTKALRSAFMTDAAFSLDYGFQAWEKVWKYQQINGRTMLVLDKLKPLAAEHTKAAVLAATGEFAGIKQDEIFLGPEKSLWLTHESEAGNLYGESRHEWVRETAYGPWRDAIIKIGQLVRMICGSVPILRYPEGKSADASGSMVDNFDLGVQIINSLGAGKGVLMPDKPAAWAQELLERGADPSKVQAWKFEFLQTAAGHVAELMTMMQHFEKLMARGWLIPERAMIEAVLSGSRADSGSAVDLAMLIAEDMADCVANCWSKYVINPILIYNFGEQWRDKIRVIHESLTGEAKSYVRQIVAGYLAAPSNKQIVDKLLDIDAMLEISGVPTTMTLADVVQQIEPEPDAGVIAGLAEQLRGLPTSEIPVDHVGDDDHDRSMALGWVTINGAHVLIGEDGTIEKGPSGFVGKTPDQIRGEKSGGKSKRDKPKTKSEIAKAHMNPTLVAVQRYAENVIEPQVAKSLEGNHLPNNEPVDIIVNVGGKIHGIEVKVMVNNKARKITMNKEAIKNKRSWKRANKGVVHTVVIDDVSSFSKSGRADPSMRKVFYRRGAGSMRISAMYEVPGGLKGVKELIAIPTRQLPKGAR